MTAMQLSFCFESSFKRKTIENFQFTDRIFEAFKKNNDPLINRTKFFKIDEDCAELQIANRAAPYPSKSCSSILRQNIKENSLHSQFRKKLATSIARGYRMNYIAFYVNNSNIYQSFWMANKDGSSIWADITYLYYPSEKRYVLDFNNTNFYYRDLDSTLELKISAHDIDFYQEYMQTHADIFFKFNLDSKFMQSNFFDNFQRLFNESLQPNKLFIGYNITPQSNFSGRDCFFLYPNENLVDLNIKEVIKKFPTFKYEDFTTNYRREILQILDNILTENLVSYSSSNFGYILYAIQLNDYSFFERIKKAIEDNKRLELVCINTNFYDRLIPTLQNYFSKKKIEKFIFNNAMGSRNYYWYITDSIRMIGMLERSEQSDSVDFNRLKECDNLAEIHTWAINETNKLKNIPLKIDSYLYQTLRKINTDVPNSDYTIIIPKNSADITTWGVEQKHCIGSYASNAATKDSLCLIFGIWDNTNKKWFGHYMTTLTSSHLKNLDLKAMHAQFYGKYNISLPADKKAMILDYVSSELNFQFKRSRTNQLVTTN